MTLPNINGPHAIPQNEDDYHDNFILNSTEWGRGRMEGEGTGEGGGAQEGAMLKRDES